MFLSVIFDVIIPMVFGIVMSISLRAYSTAKKFEIKELQQKMKLRTILIVLIFLLYLVAHSLFVTK